MELCFRQNSFKTSNTLQIFRKTNITDLLNTLFYIKIWIIHLKQASHLQFNFNQLLIFAHFLSSKLFSKHSKIK